MHEINSYFNNQVIFVKIVQILTVTSTTKYYLLNYIILTVISITELYFAKII